MSHLFRLLAFACLGGVFSSPLRADAGHSHGKDSFGAPGKDPATARVIFR